PGRTWLSRPQRDFQATRKPDLFNHRVFPLGLIAGAVSLLVFPRSFIASRELRLLNLIVTPLVAGETMRQIGKLRERRGQTLVKLDRFFYAFAFALAMALVRYFLTKVPV